MRPVAASWALAAAVTLLWGAPLLSAAPGLALLLVPGLLVARAVLPEAGPEAHLGLALGFAAIVLPHLALALAMLGGTVLSLPVVAAAALSACAASLAARGGRAVPGRGELEALLSTPLAPWCVVAAVAAASLASGQPPPQEAAYVSEMLGGVSRFRQADEGCEPVALPSLPENLAVHVEPLGGPASLAALRLAGAEASLALGLAWAAAVAALAAAGTALSGRPWPSLALSLAVLFSPLCARAFAEGRVTHLASVPAAALVLLLALLARRPPAFALLGMAFGSLGGVLHITALMLPALGWAAWSSPCRWRALAALAAGCALTALPWAWWHRLAYGAVLVHETQQPLAHLSPWSSARFAFNGMLGSLLEPRRTPGFPFPASIYLPLACLASLGALLAAASLLGLAALPHRARSLLLAWALPFAVFVGLMENWDPTKTFLILPVYVAAAVPAAAWASSFAADRERELPRLALLALALLALPRVLPPPDLPLDGRWAERFPGREPPQGDLQFARTRLASPGMLPSRHLLPPRRVGAPTAGPGRLGVAGLGADPCDPRLRCFWARFEDLEGVRSALDPSCSPSAFTGRYDQQRSHLCALALDVPGCPSAGELERTLAARGAARDRVV